jgi:5'-phosphate synthase pdxT subunit
VIGVLALQGNFDAHIKVIKKLNLDYRLVNKSKDLDCLDGLVFPGGESTTI